MYQAKKATKILYMAILTLATETPNTAYSKTFEGENLCSFHNFLLNLIE